jgi:hypothetical protein
MIEPLNPNLPQVQTVAPEVGRSGRMAPTYIIGFAFLVGLQILSSLLEASKKGLSVSPTYVAAVATAAVLAPVVLAIPAGLITAIGAIWIKKGRGLLFVKSHFYLMVILIPVSVFTQLFRLYLAD